MNKCEICPRNCKVNRETKAGFCGEKSLKINKVMVHFWEEPIISGTNGSGTIFFSGCSLKCLFCQNYEISHENKGQEISVENLVSIFKYFENLNVHNINLVTPTHFANEIIQALKIYKPKIPIVWNTSGYEKPETILKLKNYVDIFLFDLKYYDEKLSFEYSKAKDYFFFASESLKVAKSIIPKNIIENGLMKKGIIIRHLVLPKASSDSIKIIDYIYKTFKNKEIVSVLNQYTPYYKALTHPVLKNKVSELEYKRVVKHLINLNFENAYTQESSSSSTCYIPNFKETNNLEEIFKKF